MSNKEGFERNFWVAIVMEFFERGAYYGVLSILSVYLVISGNEGGLGFSKAQAGTIMGTIQPLLYRSAYSHFQDRCIRQSQQEDNPPVHEKRFFHNYSYECASHRQGRIGDPSLAFAILGLLGRHGRHKFSLCRDGCPIMFFGYICRLK